MLSVPGVIAQEVTDLHHGAVMLAVLVLSVGDGSNAGVSAMLMVAVREGNGDVDPDHGWFAPPHWVVVKILSVNMFFDGEHHLNDDMLNILEDLDEVVMSTLEPVDNLKGVFAMQPLASVRGPVGTIIANFVIESGASGGNVLRGSVAFDLTKVDSVVAFGDNATEPNKPNIPVLLEAPRLAKLAAAVIALEPPDDGGV